MKKQYLFILFIFLCVTTYAQQKTYCNPINIDYGYTRLHLLSKYVEGNKRIKNRLATKPKTAFVNVYDAMLTKDGKPMPDIFKEDNLHMNAKGYAIWKKILQPYLMK